jgi:hypothetical protein
MKPFYQFEKRDHQQVEKHKNMLPSSIRRGAAEDHTARSPLSETLVRSLDTNTSSSAAAVVLLLSRQVDDSTIVLLHAPLSDEAEEVNGSRRRSVENIRRDQWQSMD